VGSLTGALFSCELGPLTNHGWAVVEVLARGEIPGVWSGRASLLVASGDPQLFNNAAPLNVTVITPPRLAIQISGNNLVLSWMEGGYALVCATNLNEPAHWLPVTNGVETVPGGQQVLLPPVAGSKFFRLRQE